jgi:Putative zinc-finger
MWASNMFESCVEIRSHFSDYVDDLCPPETLKSIRFHLTYCQACGEELEGWQSLRADLRALPRRRVPSDLALRLRVGMSHQLHPSPFPQLWVRLENVLKPLLIPATGGVLTAVICFCLIMGSQAVRVTSLPDVSLSIVTSPRVREFAPMDFNTGDNPLVLVTQIDAEGRVKSYRVLSGHYSPEVMHHLDRMIYFTVFQPATSFGKPTDGEVVLSLRRITVRG